MQQLKRSMMSAPHLFHSNINIQKIDGTQCQRPSLKAKILAATAAFVSLIAAQHNLVIRKTVY